MPHYQVHLPCFAYHVAAFWQGFIVVAVGLFVVVLIQRGEGEVVSYLNVSSHS